MSRNLTFEQGCFDMDVIMAQYMHEMRDKKVQALVSITLLGVVAGCGEKSANLVISKYELSCPSNGSHEWFNDGEDHKRVIHLDPNFTIPDKDRIFPWERGHPAHRSFKAQFKMLPIDDIKIQLGRFVEDEK
jgi:hypothetical protein